MKRTDGSTDPISCAKAKTNGRRKLLKANSRRERRSCTTLTLVNKETRKSYQTPNMEAHKQEGAYTSPEREEDLKRTIGTL
ncbi:hypothetical protein EVAR_29700_1 [Eumeta japonica]|uniref:Uncharacterized protein n=1 Tax=Eumeta variegata TaxID=151549 RepID=A0A4C1VZP6_EUMVA|nr:hypothetical protein EVAR_29700_1 [Eumeta japonica]